MMIFTTSLSEASQLVAYVSSARTRIDWMDQAIQRIHKSKEFQVQLHKATILKAKVKEAEVFLQQTRTS